MAEMMDCTKDDVMVELSVDKMVVWMVELKADK